MAKVKFAGDQPVTVPELGGRLLEPGQVIDILDADVPRFCQSALWKPADPKAQKLHDAANDNTDTPTEG